MGKKALIIGIDGVPYDLLQELVAKGVMPELGKILGSGYNLYEMKASLPDISSVSWTSFMTGVNPGVHGIYGFTQLMPSSYSLYFPNSTHIKAPTFWQTLHSRGKIDKTIVLNLPNTYPAFPIDGLLVSGFVAIDFNKAVYPLAYIPSLKKINYIIDVDLQKARTDKDGFYGDLVESLSVRQEASLSLLKEETWDIFMLCVTETDRLHHFFLDKRGTPAFEALYRKLDGLIAAMYKHTRQKFGDDFLFLMLSDHGFVPLKTEVNVNVCLQNAGLLRLDERKEYYERIAPGTTAFAMDPGRIYIHYEGKFPAGHVKKSDGEKVKENLRKLFAGLVDGNGSPVIRKIYEKEEIYSGPFTDSAPDLLLMANDGFDLKGNLRKQTVFSTDIFTGMHSWHNAIFVAPEYIKIANGINIEHPSRILIDYFS
jgi:predicted AlkP superfamily phosphohydrolase/phosphomutase